MSPILYLPPFYLYTEMVKGNSWSGAKDVLRKKYVDTTLMLWAMWIPGQLVNFWLVPPPLRNGFIYAIEFVWVLAISWFSNKPTDEPPLDLVEAAKGKA
jgi:hypothetical protein